MRRWRLSNGINFASQKSRRSAIAIGFPRACLAATLLGTMSLGGCAPAPFDPGLTFAVPARFEAGSTTKAQNASRWWTRFGAAELDRLMDTANVENLDLAVAAAQLKAAEAQITISGAALWPVFDYTDNNSRSQTSGTTVRGAISPPVARNSFSKVLGASYILDIWGQNRDALEASIRSATASAYQIEVVRLATRASVVNSYLLYAANRERAAVARQNLRNADRILRVIRERSDAGTASDLDIQQQVSLTEIQRANIPPLNQAADTARTALALLIGQPVQMVHLGAARVQRLRVPDAGSGFPSSLLFRRPDVKAAELQLAAADADVEVARKAFLPTITLAGQAGFQSALLSTLLRPESFIYSIAGGLTQTIFDGGRLRGQLALTEAQRQQLLETYRKSIVSALTDVENALIGIRENASRERAQRAAVDAARRAFNLSEDRLNQGAIDITQLLTVQNTLFQTEDTLIEVRLARLQAIASLFQAIGGDWEEPIVVQSRYGQTSAADYGTAVPAARMRKD